MLLMAGIGALGKSSLLINRDFGNMLTLGAILTDLDVESDDFAENICIKGCTLCIDNCPANALEGGNVSQLRCRQNAYGTNKRGFDTVNCNKCREICPLKYGKSPKK